VGSGEKAEVIPQKPQWNLIILDLIRAGMTHADIAKKVGCSESAIGTIKNHVCNDCRFSIGAGILNLHAEVMKNADNKTGAGELGTLGAGQIPQTALREHRA
jgi:hypothetical protein